MRSEGLSNKNKSVAIFQYCQLFVMGQLFTPDFLI